MCIGGLDTWMGEGAVVARWCCSWGHLLVLVRAKTCACSELRCNACQLVCQRHCRSHLGTVILCGFTLKRTTGYVMALQSCMFPNSIHVCVCVTVFLRVSFSPSMPRTSFAWYYPARSGMHMERIQIHGRDITRALDVTGTSEVALCIICCEVSPSTMISLHLSGHAG